MPDATSYPDNTAAILQIVRNHRSFRTGVRQLVQHYHDTRQTTLTEAIAGLQIVRSQIIKELKQRQELH